MKRLLIALLLLAAPAWAEEPVQLARMSGPMLGAGVSAVAIRQFPCVDATHLADNTAVLVCEDFEGSSECESGSASTCRSADRWGAGADSCQTPPTYNSTPGLLGSYAVLHNEPNGYNACNRALEISTSESITSLFVEATIATLHTTATAAELVFMRTSSAAACYANIVNGKWAVYAGGTTTDSGVAASSGTHYYIWLDFVKGTSCSLYVSETSSKPASPTVSYGTSIVNAVIAKIYLGSSNPAGDNDVNEIKYDNLAVSESVLGSM